MSTLREILAGNEAVVAPTVLNPMMAKLAEAAGFRALYLSGGSLGWMKCVTEATLSLNEMCDAGAEIRAVSNVPLILDGAGGWGDPMHMHRTIAMSERAGFAAIEIEDVVLPKRAHHHIGQEHVIASDMMEAKIREAVAARTDPEFVIIARTDSQKTHGIDHAIERGHKFRAAGADVLFIWTHNEAEMRRVGEELGAGGPLMVFTGRDGTGKLEMPRTEMAKLGYRLIGVTILPLLSMHRALAQTYAAIAADQLDPQFPGGVAAETEAMFKTVELEKLLEVERRTVEAVH